MAIHAHPDDEASKGAATMAKYAAEGIDVMVVTCTGGERGDVLHSAAEEEVKEHGIAEVRRREMANAVEILGVRHAWLGYEDSGFPDPEVQPPLPLPEGCFADLPIEVELVPMVRLIREFRPQVVTTYDENGGYPHPDHLRVHSLTLLAVEAAADPEFDSELEPWTVSKIYYNMQFARGRIYALHEAMIEAGVESQYTEWIKRMESRPDESHRITTSINVAEYFPQRDAALLAHRTQVDPSSQWFAVPVEVQARIWPTEEFELAKSLVPTELPENDLFAGLRTDVSAR
jgi:mycothiol S-conjugate amidase